MASTTRIRRSGAFVAIRHSRKSQQRESLQRLEQHHRIHVSFDADCLDLQAGPGVGTPVPGGLNWREAHLAMELIADCCCCCSMDIVEINPILDHHNRTAQLAVELAASLFGKRIL